jgi:hypothetical protein
MTPRPRKRQRCDETSTLLGAGAARRRVGSAPPFGEAKRGRPVAALRSDSDFAQPLRDRHLVAVDACDALATALRSLLA